MAVMETAIPPSFLWPWLYSFDLDTAIPSLLSVSEVFTHLSCPATYSCGSFRHALCLHFIPKLRVRSHQQGGQTRAKSVYWCLQHLFWGRGDREDWRWPPQASPYTAPRLGCFFILYFFFFLEGTGSNYLIISPLPTIPAQSHFGFYTFSL